MHNRKKAKENIMSSKLYKGNCFESNKNSLQRIPVEKKTPSNSINTLKTELYFLSVIVMTKPSESFQCTSHMLGTLYIVYQLVIAIFWDMHYFPPILQRKKVKETEATWPAKHRARTQTQTWMKTKPKLSHSLHYTTSHQWLISEQKYRKLVLFFSYKSIVLQYWNKNYD